MRGLAIAAVLFLAIVPAHAQGPSFGDGKKKEDPAVTARREAEQDQAYKSSLQRIPTKDAAVDPWGSTRMAPSETNPPAQNRPKKPQAAPAAQ